MTYREMAIKTVQIACRDLIENVGTLIPENTSGTYDMEIIMKIPTLSNKIYDIPTYKITINSYLGQRAVEKVFNVWKEVKDNEPAV